MTAGTLSKIVWPEPAVADCVFCVIVRDTRGVALEHLDRFNFFPASPLCCVSWLLDGDLHLIERPDQMARPWTGPIMPEFAFSGAQPGPLVSWSPGGVHVITLGFYPDAFARMTGIDLGPYTGRMVTAANVLTEPIVGLCRDFRDSVRDDGIDHELEGLLDCIGLVWSGVRPLGSRPVRRLKDWSARLALRAAMSAPGRSTRQISRRIKAWSGLSGRDLEGLSHSEQLYAKIHEAVQDGALDWAEVAAAAGFSDQAHMIRRMRQHTGFTPEQLRKGAASDEAFWSYRLLAQYFAKP